MANVTGNNSSKSESRKNGIDEQSVPHCKDCKSFNGLAPFSEDGPPGYCSPEGSTISRPCEPWEVAINKPCFIPS